MPTRALRTDTTANIADFGASPGADNTFALTNAQAFVNALAASTKVVIPATPAGQFYAFAELPLLPAGVEIFGEGPTRTVLRYYPVGPFNIPPGDYGMPASIPCGGFVHNSADAARRLRVAATMGEGLSVSSPGC